MPLNLFTDKKYKKRLEQWFGLQWVNLVTLLTRFLTLKRAQRLGRFLGNLAFYVVIRHRRKALRNAAMIYGKEKSKKQLYELVRSSFIHSIRFGWEILYFHTHDISNKEITEVVRTIEGLEHLQQAAAREKGVIGLGLHLGNFTLLGKRLRTLGFQPTSIMRQMRDQKLEEMFKLMRIKFGEHWIPKFPVSQAIRKSIAWLEEGKILLVYIDQRSGRGVKVDFMGIPTPTPTGAAVFALKTGAAVLPMINILDTDGTYKLIIGKEVPVIRTGNHRKDVELNTAQFNKIAEKYIRRYPDQWFWFHNRWKGVKNNS